ncbi:TOPRIM nucleotidyl transferase/hydrolase domain-containing protein [Vampirovibrio sp.]|uniref:TOPRIM nucleotidyl transferase/hydrolase domain-containing protein n=1 Tax=Vampirovibrio sp. TaxID=2717857 RepID=UPI003594237B
MGLKAIPPNFESREPSTPEVSAPTDHSQPLDAGGFANPAEPLKSAQKMVEVALKDEREGIIRFSFKTPGWDNLAASANRLLKFEFPTIRDIKVCERLIKTNVLSTGLSKKALETLPLHSLETIYVNLWRAWFGDDITLADEWLSLFLLAEDLDGFQLSAMVEQDVEQLGLRDQGAMHSYYYRGALSKEQMATFLTGHGYRTDYLGATQKLEISYLLCRRLTRPLPWSALLNKLEPADLKRYPRLAYLKALYEALGQKKWIVQPITPDTAFAQLNQLSQWLNHKDFSRMGAAYHLPRPVKALVIVEGETEKLLLPMFAQAMQLDFNLLGIHLLPAGGKNHVLSIYRQQAQTLNCPIFIVLDQDAGAIAQEIRTNFRQGDYIFTIQEGEFEDLYDMALVLKTINLHYQPYPEVTAYSFLKLTEESKAKGRVQALKVLWQSYNLGSFDKIDFAIKYTETFQQSQLSKEVLAPPKAIRRLIETILTVRHSSKAYPGF